MVSKIQISNILQFHEQIDFTELVTNSNFANSSLNCYQTGKTAKFHKSLDPLQLNFL